jgi:hypothetical protein
VGTNFIKQHKTMHVKKKDLDSVPNKGHWGVFNAPFTKGVINRL